MNRVDITDRPTEFQPRDSGHLEVMLTAKLSRIERRVHDEPGKPIRDCAVLLFSSAEAGQRRAGSGVQLSAQPGASLDQAGRAALRAQRDRVLATYDGSKAATLIEGFRQHGTWHCPTLVVLRAGAFLNDRAFTNDPRFAFPGFSLHDELALLVEAGLTPAQALRTATVNPARYLGKLESQGTVDVGKAADLVLLDANPLDDIKATTGIAAVVFGSRVFDRAALDRMLRQAEALSKGQEDR